MNPQRNGTKLIGGLWEFGFADYGILRYLFIFRVFAQRSEAIFYVDVLNTHAAINTQLCELSIYKTDLLIATADPIGRVNARNLSIRCTRIVRKYRAYKIGRKMKIER